LPANSGAITGTVAHKHSALGSDGGFLDDGITGVTGTANGSLLVSDGSSILQDLPVGNLNDVLTMGASVPAWSAGGSSGKFELVSDTTLGSDQNDITVTISPAIVGTDIACLRCVAKGNTSTNGGSLSIQVNGITTSTYEYTQIGTYNGTSIDVLSKTGHAFYKAMDGTNAPFYSTFDISVNPVTDLLHIQSITGETDNSAQTHLYTVSGSNSTASQTTISEVKFFIDSGGIDLLQNTNLKIYKILS
jgi:hypothetical protein